MENEAWLNGKLDGFIPLAMPAAHALAQSITDLERVAPRLSDERLSNCLKGSPSIAFHLRHIAGSIDRLLTYSRGEELSERQFARLKSENQSGDDSAGELTRRAIEEINRALAALKNVAPGSLFEERFVGREKLPTNVFGLLFHIAEHTARHTGQIVTLANLQS